MPKPNERSATPSATPREAEALKLFNEGVPAEEAAKRMGLAHKGSFAACISMLRRKGLVPLLPEGAPRAGRRITEIGPPPSKMPDERPLALKGLASAQPVEGVVEEREEAPRRRRKSGPKEGISITTHALAKQLDDEIHQHIQNGGRMDKVHRWCMVLVGELLGD